jgi:hypothetical protein
MVFTSRRHSMLSEAAAQIKLSNIDSIRTWNSAILFGKF